MKGHPVITWTTTGTCTVTGQSPTWLDAWQQGAAAAVGLLAEHADSASVLITVGTDSARLYAAADEHGRYSATETQAIANRLIEEIQEELG